MPKRLTLEQCGSKRCLHGLAPGSYEMEYTDSTHLQSTEWVRLATVDVRSSAIPLEDNNTEQFYTLTKQIGDLPGKPKAAAPAKGADKADAMIDYDRRIRVIDDTLALALGRVGLIAPQVPAELLAQLLELDEQDGVVIVPDTNALHNGAVHWLLRVLHRPSVWLMPVVASLTTIQTRDATVKGLVNKCKINNLGQALRSRGLVNGALGLLERNKGRCQVVEIDPSLLRYQKVASSSGADPDQSDVLEDRLIIEAIHGVLRSMRSRTARRVVTSDVNIARVLAAEGIETLFVPSIALGEAPVDCLRFDALARGFVGAPLRATMWELTHAFGTIRLLKNGTEQARLECYWPGKTPGEWASETLVCEFSGSKVAPVNIDAPGETKSLVPDTQVGVTSEPAQRSLNGGNHAIDSGSADRGEPMQNDGKPARPKRWDVAHQQPPQKRAVPITTSLPRASLTQMLRLLGIARRLNGGTVEQFVAEMGADAISPDAARRPLEILRRIKLLDQLGNQFQPTPDIALVDTALRGGDLDSLSQIMERFIPYQAFLETLRVEGRILRADVSALVRQIVGGAGEAESDRLPRFHVLLGQAWTDGKWIVDGSGRPTDRDATDAFEEAFHGTASVGISKMQDLLFRYCELTKMSPWAAKRQIEKFVAARMLPEFNFQPAAGAKPITRDEIVTGSLDHVMTEPVIVDRIFLGERPVFTVEGPSQ